MSGITRWNPFEGLSRFDPSQEMGDMLRSLGMQPLHNGPSRPMELRTDISEGDGAYQVSVEIPGARKEDIDVSIEGRQVAITVETRSEKREEKGKSIHTERYEGTAYRAFTLPEEVDRSKASARYEDGVLRLTLPKQGGAPTHRVVVQ